MGKRTKIKAKVLHSAGAGMYDDSAPGTVDALQIGPEELAAHDAAFLLEGRPATRPLVPVPPQAYRVAELLASNGVTPTNIAVALGVSLAVMENWFYRDTEFLQAYRRGKDVFDTFGIERALVGRALGYDYTEKTVETIELDAVLPDGAKVKLPATKTKVSNRHIPADTSAIVFYLKNRAAHRWKDGKHFDITVPGGADAARMDLNKLSVRELKELQGIMKKALAADLEMEVPKDAETVQGDIDSETPGPDPERV